MKQLGAPVPYPFRHGRLSDGNPINMYIWDPLGGNGISRDLRPRKIIVVLKPTKIFVDT